jgi:hypothetical protein
LHSNSEYGSSDWEHVLSEENGWSWRHLEAQMVVLVYMWGSRIAGNRKPGILVIPLLLTNGHQNGTAWQNVPFFSQWRTVPPIMHPLLGFIHISIWTLISSILVSKRAQFVVWL